MKQMLRLMRLPPHDLGHAAGCILESGRFIAVSTPIQGRGDALRLLEPIVAGTKTSDRHAVAAPIGAPPRGVIAKSLWALSGGRRDARRSCSRAALHSARPVPASAPRS